VSDQIPIHERRVVYQIPGMNQVHVEQDIAYKSEDPDYLRMDVYRPKEASTSERLPGVVFIHGGPIDADFRPRLKDWGQYQSYGELIAASEMIAITFNHRYHHVSQLPKAADDVRDALSFIQEHGASWGLDPNRLCLWGVSGGGLFLSYALRERPTHIGCLVAYYALLDPRQIEDATKELNEDELRVFSPILAMRETPSKDLPVFVARVGKDYPGFKKSNDLFIRQAIESEAALVVANHPNGQHAFDLLDNNPRSRWIIETTIEFAKSNLVA
jgi:acetyl esterase/lipase